MCCTLTARHQRVRAGACCRTRRELCRVVRGDTKGTSRVPEVDID